MTGEIVVIRNTSKPRRPVTLRLNSGETLIIKPGTTSKEISAVEVKDNPMINKLQNRLVIEVHEKEKRKRPRSGSKTKRKKSTDKSRK